MYSDSEESSEQVSIAYDKTLNKFETLRYYIFYR